MPKEAKWGLFVMKHGERLGTRLSAAPVQGLLLDAAADLVQGGQAEGVRSGPW
jgi:hypothetical protein